VCDFDPSSFIGDGWGWLFVVAGVAWGRFVSVEVEARTVVFEFESVADRVALTPEESPDGV